MKEDWNVVAVYNTGTTGTIYCDGQQTAIITFLLCPVLQCCSVGWGGLKVEGFHLWPWKSANCAIETSQTVQSKNKFPSIVIGVSNPSNLQLWKEQNSKRMRKMNVILGYLLLKTYI